ncbi:GNAT family N-acetyltransferase [Viridibacterium curvum]|uniref:N-acetyltransferase domain-containing protein n=1 Tax=Viridibacterium curvum TaxID=1101404 RepID=A0ABP9QRM7_9RHOO
MRHKVFKGELMNLVSFRPEMQGALEAFLQIMQESRGYKFDRSKLPPDIANVKTAYKDCGGDLWVVKNDDAIVGSIALRALDPDAGIGEIKRYFVLPSYQRRGIGGDLMHHAINVARESGLRRVRLDTMKKSEAALIVFRKFGFYEIPKYNNNNVAEIFMEKLLSAATN